MTEHTQDKYRTVMDEFRTRVNLNDEEYMYSQSEQSDSQTFIIPQNRTNTKYRIHYSCHLLRVIYKLSKT